MFVTLSQREGFGVYSSPHLMDWAFESHLPGFYACPDAFQLAVENNIDDIRWVVLDWAKYALAKFDGHTFSLTIPLMPLDRGKCFSANQTWPLSNDPLRRVQIAWVRYGEFPNMPFSQQMTFPCKLTLRNTPEGPRLFRKPNEAVETPYTATHAETCHLLCGEEHIIPISTPAVDLELDLSLSSESTFELAVMGNRISYCNKTGKGQVAGAEFELNRRRTELKMRILTDTASLEVFLNSRETCLTQAVLPNLADLNLEFSSHGTPYDISMTIAELDSIWPII